MYFSEQKVEWTCFMRNITFSQVFKEEEEEEEVFQYWPNGFTSHSLWHWICSYENGKKPVFRETQQREKYNSTTAINNCVFCGYSQLIFTIRIHRVILFKFSRNFFMRMWFSDIKKGKLPRGLATAWFFQLSFFFVDKNHQILRVKKAFCGFIFSILAFY